MDGWAWYARFHSGKFCAARVPLWPSTVPETRSLRGWRTGSSWGHGQRPAAWWSESGKIWFLHVNAGRSVIGCLGRLKHFTEGRQYSNDMNKTWLTECVNRIFSLKRVLSLGYVLIFILLSLMIKYMRRKYLHVQASVSAKLWVIAKEVLRVTCWF